MPHVQLAICASEARRSPQAATMYLGEGCLAPMYEPKQISDLHPLAFNDIGRPCDEAVSFG